MPSPIAAFNRLGTETAFEVLARAKQLEAQGRDIVHLEIGEPDFDTPANIVEELRHAGFRNIVEGNGDLEDQRGGHQSGTDGLS